MPFSRPHEQMELVKVKLARWDDASLSGPGKRRPPDDDNSVSCYVMAKRSNIVHRRYAGPRSNWRAKTGLPTKGRTDSSFHCCFVIYALSVLLSQSVYQASLQKIKQEGDKSEEREQQSVNDRQEAQQSETDRQESSLPEDNPDTGRSTEEKGNAGEVAPPSSRMEKMMEQYQVVYRESNSVGHVQTPCVKIRFLVTKDWIRITHRGKLWDRVRNATVTLCKIDL